MTSGLSHVNLSQVVSRLTFSPAKVLQFNAVFFSRHSAASQKLFGHGHCSMAPFHAIC